ncbi:Glutamate carboxypeptidase II precursor [Lunatimonas lonarensis]|uniref:Glutamate carboxypeptidase II n=1 Tax=Lunatimonas lonarensis TaxID=1232681 RepID=R7ZW16_9BACT|nr:M28 family peptidase [Lunatimonas lonarensis]EON78203.1 Glutamate carboxypeptidase II precursor [Lunatimonas lonarensis]
MKFAFLALFVTGFTHLQAQELHVGFSSNSLEKQLKTEERFLQQVDFSRFRHHLERISSEPHIAGSEANHKVGRYLAETMEAAGWKVQAYPYDVYLAPEPGESSVEMVTPIRQPLNQQEFIFPEDPYSSHPELKQGWNAYSGSGDVVGEIVFVNYGTKADFELLESMGISVKGKIVLARYGGNFRGYKAKFAEEYGAIGLLIFTDPGDSGYAKGLVYPEGIYYNESSVQRGSLLTLPFTGDPLTPFVPALPLDGKEQVKRLSPEEAPLPTIPVTSIPYGSAKEIIGKMTGTPVPSGWQGGLPYTYRLDGGSDLTVRLKVNQKRELVRINNVVGVLEGSTYPDEWVILGCHYDAWSFGATDPNSGTAMLLALSETLGKLANNGDRPKRSILIAHWDGEEHGVIGSSEWVEQFKEELQAKAVAYMNFDAGVSGPNVRGASSPTLKHIMAGATRSVKLPDSEQTIFDSWAGKNAEPSMGSLGGGSDHIAFYMFAGIPSLSGGAGGPTLYHTNYDNLFFYEKFADPTFKMGGAVEQWVGIMALRTANADVVPYRPSRYAEDLTVHFEAAERQISSFSIDFKGFSKSAESIKNLASVALTFEKKLQEVLASNRLSTRQAKALSRELLGWEKSFLRPEGMPFGNWYQSLYASTDPFSGYASWVLPAIQYSIELKDVASMDTWDSIYSQAIDTLSDRIRAAQFLIDNE